jgi:hypothetical protein
MANKIRWNPLSGEFDYVSTTASSGGPTTTPSRIVLNDLQCDSGAAVGQPCREDPLISGKVLVETDNSNAKWPTGVFGVILQKPTATTCSVLVLGEADLYTGLTAAKNVFLSPTGNITQVVPTSGILQRVGRATSSSKLFVNVGVKTVRS